jgi:hypothetical protein
VRGGFTFSMLYFDIPSCAGEMVSGCAMGAPRCPQQRTNINRLLLHILGLLHMSVMSSPRASFERRHEKVFVRGVRPHHIGRLDLSYKRTRLAVDYAEDALEERKRSSCYTLPWYVPSSFSFNAAGFSDDMVVDLVAFLGTCN